MGKATTLIGLTLFVSMISLIAALGIQSLDPTSPLLASNALLNNDNIVYNQVNTSGDTWTFDKDYTSTNYLPTREATGTPEGTVSQFPDWTFSGWNWITSTFKILLNCVGAPYTLAVMIGPTSSAAAIIGATLAIFNLFIIVGWILGKID